MKKPQYPIIMLFISLLIPKSIMVAQSHYPTYIRPQNNSCLSNKLPNQYMPVIGVWVWTNRQLIENGYMEEIDKADSNSPFNILVLFLRFPDREVIQDEIYKQVKKAAEYAAEHNISLVADLDIREARQTFISKHPNELQQMLRIKEVELSERDLIKVSVNSLDLNDHYTGGMITHHIPLSGKLLKIYAYTKTPEGIEQESMSDITRNCNILCSTKDSVKVEINTKEIKNTGKTHVCLLVSFSHLYPDVFSPYLIAFQREIIHQYANVKLAGVCKDEWGFPPYYPRFYKSGCYDFWYSENYAHAYCLKTGGRDLLSDFILMAIGINGKESERQMAINHFNEMSYLRNTELETDYYNTVKEVFGPNAAVTVHSTWWPFPDRNEFRKNGLDWWASKRDWAQTDEVVPYAVRTALSKKWGSPIWYNMYYKMDLPVQLWSAALGGGRINYLPFQSLYNEKLMRAECRIRLLNCITKSPLYCPVAVIFGHTASMNWAGPYYNDVGMELVDSLWKKGYPADLIPTSEIENGNLQVTADGYISYGNQKYTAAIIYHPEFEKKSTADFIIKAAKGKTKMIQIGKWTKNFEGMPYNDEEMLCKIMPPSENKYDALLKIFEALKKNEIPAQTPATGIIDNRYFGLRDFNSASCSPANEGFCRLIDGTVIYAAGTKDMAGDTIRTIFRINNYSVYIDAVGIAAIRLNDDGSIQALAAGGLKSIKTNNFEIKLDERTDIALWTDEKGIRKGIIQSENGIIPVELKKVADQWTAILLPIPPK
jgi:hypothetical protein